MCHLLQGQLISSNSTTLLGLLGEGKELSKGSWGEMEALECISGGPGVSGAACAGASQGRKQAAEMGEAEP